MRGLKRLTNAANRIEALSDLQEAIKNAERILPREQVSEMLPESFDGLGWRALDKLTKKVRDATDEAWEAYCHYMDTEEVDDE